MEIENKHVGCKGYPPSIQITTMIISPLKYHGGKHYLAKRLWELAKSTPHIHRVETHGGSLAFTFACDPEGYSEVVNDIDGDLTNFWMVLRNPDYFPHFVRVVQATPFDEQLWGWCRDAIVKNNGQSDTFLASDPVKRAWVFFVTNRQSLAGRMTNFTGITKTRTRRSMNNEVSAWLSVIDGLPSVYTRLQRVLIIGPKDAIEVIKSQDSPNTLFYCDPPYLLSTRTPKVYTHEYTIQQHRDLIGVLKQCKGKFMLSGYRSVLYDSTLRSYNRHDFDIANHASSSTTKRRMVECVWCNF